MLDFKLSVNMSIFDGYNIDEALASVKSCGYQYFELAYNQGYVGNIDPILFSENNANHINQLKDKYQLNTVALGCTMDLAASNMVELFKQRIIFAHKIGATYLNVCTAKMSDYNQLITNLKGISPILKEYGCILCLENGGDYNYNAFIFIEDGLKIINDVNSDAISINFDPGNMVTYNQNLDVQQQSLSAIPHCSYFHIKDVKIEKNEFYFPSIGQGIINYTPIVTELRALSIPVSFEIPLRMHRLPDSTPIRSNSIVDKFIIEKTLKDSLNYIKSLI